MSQPSDYSVSDNDLMYKSDPVSDVIILGGGIAGIAAALELLDAGRHVMLVEARGFLGGRAFSFTDGQTGLSLDNGQHVIVGCCTQFIDFMDRLGAKDRWFLQKRLRIPAHSRAGKAGTLSASSLPAPFHLLPSLLAYPHLGPMDKLRVLAGMLRARLTDRHHPDLEHVTFYQWLRENGQSDRAINNLWNLVVEPTLNDNVRDVSAAMGLMIVQGGMLDGAANANLGYAVDGLLPAIGEPAKKLLEERGARLVFGDPIRNILLSQDSEGTGTAGRATSLELASGRRLCSETFVSALPFSALLRVLPPETAALDFFRDIGKLEWSPIVNLHILYDRPVMEEPFCAFVDSPLQWVFNRSMIAGEGMSEGKQLLTVSVSAAWQYIDLPRQELAETFLAEFAQVFPSAREAVVESISVVKQREATFRCLPGANLLRPGPDTTISNLFLAGEWTNTGWPSTMEGAVRSGYSAARSVIQSQGLADNAEVP